MLLILLLLLQLQLHTLLTVTIFHISLLRFSNSLSVNPKKKKKMSNSSNYVCCHRNRHISFYLMLLLVSSLTQVWFMAEGRSLSSLLHVGLGQTGIEDEKAFVRRSMIGSRPPRCERRCSSCPLCEAIQVPVTAQSQSRRSRQFTAAEFSISYSRGDDISNYKPMSWKCKCGDLIFNP